MTKTIDACSRSAVDPSLLVLRAMVLLHLGEHQAADPLVRQLAAIGWVYAELTELLSRQPHTAEPEP